MAFLLCFLLILPLPLCSCVSTPGPAAPDYAEAEESPDNPGGEEEAVDAFFHYGELPPDAEALPVLDFTEIWAYLRTDREWALKVNYPISDLVYFSAGINTYGKLTGVPNRRRVANFPGRVHLAIEGGGMSLTHFVLEPGSALRRALIADILEAARPYDGLNIDFESIPARDRDHFLSFLKELREGLGNKMFTIAVQARTRPIADDVFNYERIKPLVDRIFVMAYDEHWSGSEPGPIASLGWCRSVAEYALRTVGPEKLVMGLPFYGRAWGDANPAKAYTHPQIETAKKETPLRDNRRENGIPTYSYETVVKVRAYYEDAHSLNLRGGIYRGLGVRSIGFWSLGQEDTSVWNFFRLR